jgi:DNA-binding beta-propeller fold protein YncE
MRRSALFLFVAALTAPIVLAQPAMAATEAQLVRAASQTSTWSTPSPDPTGLTYNPKKHLLMISDSEVDEDGLWHGRNLFIAGRKGGLVSTRRVTKASIEPEGIAWDAKTRSLLVADDDLDAVFRFKPGRDGKIGTRDDRVAKLLNTRRFGSYDPEGLDWRGKKNMIILSDATDNKIYKIRRGRDLRWGTRDDRVTKFGTTKFGFNDPEGVKFDPATRHLFMVDSGKKFILETTMAGKIIRKIGTPFCAAGCHLSDLVFAPGTDGSRRRLYLTDRGRDNDLYPDPADYNDGKLYQVKFVTVP